MFKEQGEKEGRSVNWKLLAIKALPIVLTVASIITTIGLYWGPMWIQ
jgi:hypothetical protein